MHGTSDFENVGMVNISSLCKLAEHTPSSSLDGTDDGACTEQDQFESFWNIAMNGLRSILPVRSRTSDPTPVRAGTPQPGWCQRASESTGQ